MKRGIKLIPAVAIIFILSSIAVIMLTNYTNNVEIKDRVVRVERIIKAGEPIINNDGSNIKEVSLSKDWLTGVSYFRNISSLKDLYAKETLYPGDIIRADRVCKKSWVLSQALKPGYERISIDIRNPFNAVDFQISKKELIALDCTTDWATVDNLSNTYGKTVLKEGLSQDKQATVRVINSVAMLSFCDKSGNMLTDEERQKNNNTDISSLIIDVQKKDAMIIQMLRGNDAVFEITKLSGTEENS